MDFEESLFSYLKNHAGIKAAAGERIYPLVIPQKSPLPALTYQKVSGYRQHNLQGDCGAVSPVYQVSVRAKTYQEVKHLAIQVRFALQNFTGIMGGETGMQVEAALLEGETEGFEQDTKTYYVNMDFQFFYTEEME